MSETILAALIGFAGSVSGGIAGGLIGREQLKGTTSVSLRVFFGILIGFLISLFFVLRVPNNNSQAGGESSQSQLTMVEVTREVPITVEVTRQIPVTVEVTREVPVTVEVTRVVAGIQPTPLPIVSPSNSVGSDTPTDTVLTVGQTWHQSGYDITLSRATLATTGYELAFMLRSRKSQEVALEYVVDLTASDNRGQTLQVLDPWDSPACGAVSVAIKPEEIQQIWCAHPTGNGWSPYMIIPINTADPTLTEIVVTLHNFAGIVSARWRIQVPH